MDDQCAICREEIQPGSFPQLQFDGTWVCQDCVDVTQLAAAAAVRTDREYDSGR